MFRPPSRLWKTLKFKNLLITIRQSQRVNQHPTMHQLQKTSYEFGRDETNRWDLDLKWRTWASFDKNVRLKDLAHDKI
jgi:hypothetical protein